MAIIEQMTSCPIWNRGALKVNPPCLCAFSRDNNCGLFYNEDGTCNLLNMTLKAKMKGEINNE